MKKETKTIAEYKAPKCKVMGVHVQNLLCSSPGDDYSNNGYIPGDGDEVEQDDTNY